MIKRLQVKFVIINMLLVTAMLGVMFVLVYSFTKQNLEQTSLSMMQSVASEPFELGRPGGEDTQVQLPYFTVQVNYRGELMATGGGYFDLSDEELLISVVTAALESGDTTGVLSQYSLRFYCSQERNGMIIVFADLSSETATLNSLIRNCVLIGIFSFAAFLLISILLSRWAVKPVATAWKEQKQFVSDASHELKTPLTVITTNAEIVLNPEYDEADRLECAQGIVAMAAQMRSLVEGLLDLARADRGRDEMEMVSLDLGAVVRDAALPFEPLYYEKGLELVYGVGQRIFISGSERHIRELVSILLDNAQKYALPTQPVYLKLWQVGAHHCRLSVSNASEPLTPQQCKDIFRRFYRVDEARTSCGSYGLGLPIAWSIVSSHKGRIWADYADGTATFSVELPTK